MTAPQLADINAVLDAFADPETGRGARKLGQIRDVNLQGTVLSLTLAQTTYSAPLWAQTRQELSEKLKERARGLTEVKIQHAVHDRPPEKLGQIGITAKSVIAVGSGKGGVGKSTMAAAIACGLARTGCQVGLLDADVYGPSIPHLFGVAGRPEIIDGKIQPAVKDNIKLMSMGLLVPPGEAVVWRGPMLHGAITQFLRDTNWGNLDYLILDMPPGTGDIAITLSQLLPLTGAVVVCTPQDVALLDAVKAIAMFQKVNIPILGMIENMSGFVCPGCGQRSDIFGSGGARRRAEQVSVPFLGEVPINLQVRLQGDAGNVGSMFEDPAVAPSLDTIVMRMVSNIAKSRAAAPAMPSLPSLG